MLRSSFSFEELKTSFVHSLTVLSCAVAATGATRSSTKERMRIGEEGRGKREEGRGKGEEGSGKREAGSGKSKIGIKKNALARSAFFNSSLFSRLTLQHEMVVERA